MSYVLGQIFGLAATAASIIMPFFKKKWMMLLNTTFINLAMLLNFVLIGHVGSAAALCAVAAVQCLVMLWHTFRDTVTHRWETLLFLLLYIGFGVFGLVTAPGFRWEINIRNLLELLPIIGALLSMSFVFIRDEQRARWLLLATCAVWSVYTGIIGVTTFFAQIVSGITAAAALYKYRKRNDKPE